MYYEASHPLVVVAMHFMLGWLETVFLQKMKVMGCFYSYCRVLLSSSVSCTFFLILKQSAAFTLFPSCINAGNSLLKFSITCFGFLRLWHTLVGHLCLHESQVSLLFLVRL